MLLDILELIMLALARVWGRVLSQRMGACVLSQRLLDVLVAKQKLLAVRSSCSRRGG